MKALEKSQKGKKFTWHLLRVSRWELTLCRSICILKSTQKGAMLTPKNGPLMKFNVPPQDAWGRVGAEGFRSQNHVSGVGAGDEAGGWGRGSGGDTLRETVAVGFPGSRPGTQILSLQTPPSSPSPPRALPSSSLFRLSTCPLPNFFSFSFQASKMCFRYSPS